LVAVQSTAAGEPDDIVVPFQLTGLDGALFKSDEELAGKLTLVLYWRLAQEHSIRCLEDLVALQKEYKGQEVAIVTFVSGEIERKKLETLVAKLELPFPVLLDPDRIVYGEFGTIVSPSTWFIDADRVIRLKYPGCRRDFASSARTEIEFLLGRISEKERDRRLEKEKSAAPSRRSVGSTIRYRLARKLLEQGEREAAREELAKAWAMDPPFAPAGVDLGLLLLEEGKNEEARVILERAAKLTPEDPRAMGAKAVALIRSGKTDEGAKLLERALEGEPTEPLYYYEMGLASQSRGSIEESSRYFRRGLELVIKRPPALE
jgi:tetratricopeptide (TPR) repeat protein